MADNDIAGRRPTKNRGLVQICDFKTFARLSRIAMTELVLRRRKLVTSEFPESLT